MIGVQVFRCYLLNRNGRIERRVDLISVNEGAALDEAYGVLRTSSYQAAELWLRDRLVTTISATDRRPVSDDGAGRPIEYP